MTARIRKGDEVEVLTGKDRSKRGTVMRVLPKEGKVIVEGINRVKKHQRQTRARVKGGIIDKDMPIHLSSLAVVCPKDGAVRVGFHYKAEGDRRSKVRVCKVCGREL
ncbi:MAG TPA: 50S ribosomal protein L24 [Acidimicrobiales bacterium]|nr:50S ribosomal protein L24 [Acidimicrobiales bacterium]